MHLGDATTLLLLLYAIDFSVHKYNYTTDRKRSQTLAEDE